MPDWLDRRNFTLLLISQSRNAGTGPPFGSEEWTRRFRDFMKELNEFIIELNDNKLDEKKWKRVCQAWSVMEQT
jgi:hypothetical protein